MEYELKKTYGTVSAYYILDDNGNRIDNGYKSNGSKDYKIIIKETINR